MSYQASSIKRQPDAVGDDILTYQRSDGKHVQAVGGVTIDGVNDIETVGDVTYIGQEDVDGEWVIKKIDEGSGVSIRYATAANNSSITDYSNAWSNRASLTYGTYSQAF